MKTRRTVRLRTRLRSAARLGAGAALRPHSARPRAPPTTPMLRTAGRTPAPLDASPMSKLTKTRAGRSTSLPAHGRAHYAVFRSWRNPCHPHRAGVRQDDGGILSATYRQPCTLRSKSEQVSAFHTAHCRHWQHARGRSASSLRPVVRGSGSGVISPNRFSSHHRRLQLPDFGPPLLIARCAATLHLQQKRIQYGRMGSVFDVGPVA